MYLHTLTLQALGPFAGRHTIDVGRLGASGIFLLEGPTGAGKSTIIDALVFALYGKVASKEASEDRLRSAHADPAVETVVDVVLEVPSGVYRIRRTPRFERPKKSGRGTTTQQPSVRLWRLASPNAPDDGELLSSRLDEVGLEVQRIIGLDRTQFVQTVVLPQGEFAGFLRANPEDRRGLLQKVFGTEVYEQLQQRLERMRAEAGRAVEDARQGVCRATAHFVGAADVGDDVAVDLRAAAETPSARSDELLGAVRGHVTSTSEAAAAAEDRAEAARARRRTAQAQLDAARSCAALLTRRTSLRDELEALTARSADHDADVTRRESAQRARAVLPLVTGAEQAEQEATAAQGRAERCRRTAPTDLQDLVDEQTELSVQRKTLTVERDRCTAVRATLTRLVTLEAGLPARRREVRDAAELLERATLEVGTLEGRCTERPERRRELASELSGVQETAALLPSAEQQVAVAQGRLGAAKDVRTLVDQVDRAGERVAAVAEEAHAAVVRLAELQQTRLRGIAGELAAELTAGEPCVVCGGTEHPRPAAPQPGHVTVEEIEAADAARAAAERRLSAAVAERSVLEERLAGRREAADGVDVDAAQTALDAARDQVAVAREARGRADALAQELERFDGATQALEASLSAARAEVASAEVRLGGLRERLEQEEAEVAAACDGAESVAARASAVDARAHLVETWCAALSAWEEACARRSTRADELDAALAEHGFADAAAVRAAHLPDRDLRALDERIAAHREDLARVRAGLAEPEVAGLAEDVTVDVPGAEEAVRTAEVEVTATGAAAAGLTARAHAATRAVSELERAVQVFRTADAESGPVVRLANLAAANGSDNSLRLTLATYVLARRFEDVVAAANGRLVTMSDGRYELVRSTEREDVGSRKTGLAMKVLDHRTETARDPRTLSGGETFYVSLCLALGLADVVTAEAGGIDLGTLFVDEGFGSLDPETLEVVLSELGRLRDGGRVVGVVSHVEALKQSIAERVEVRRLPDGSSTLAVRA